VIALIAPFDRGSELILGKVVGVKLEPVQVGDLGQVDCKFPLPLAALQTLPLNPVVEFDVRDLVSTGFFPLGTNSRDYRQHQK
jgi:hypothetical protein